MLSAIAASYRPQCDVLGYRLYVPRHPRPGGAGERLGVAKSAISRGRAFACALSFFLLSALCHDNVTCRSDT